MRRLLMVSAVAALVAVMMVSAGPAKADISIGGGSLGGSGLSSGGNDISFGGNDFSSGDNDSGFTSGIDAIQSGDNFSVSFGDDDNEDSNSFIFGDGLAILNDGFVTDDGTEIEFPETTFEFS